MQDDTQRKIRSAIFLVLRPLARFLLKGGIGYREFAEIGKRAYVDVASKDYRIRGRPTNISRVAVMTGLTRKEVRRIREMNYEGDNDSHVKDTPISQILHRWYTDPEFLTPKGEPKALMPTGADNSFAALVQKYGGDVPPGALRTELDRIDAIEELADHSLLPKKRIAYDVLLHDRLIGGLTYILYPAALGLVHNIDRADDSDWWASMVTHTKYIRDSDRGRYKRISNDRISEFSKSIDDMQAGYEALYDVEEDGDPSQGRTCGVGIFYFEEDKTDSNFFD